MWRTLCWCLNFLKALIFNMNKMYVCVKVSLYGLFTVRTVLWVSSIRLLHVTICSPLRAAIHLCLRLGLHRNQTTNKQTNKKAWSKWTFYGMHFRNKESLISPFIYKATPLSNLGPDLQAYRHFLSFFLPAMKRSHLGHVEPEIKCSPFN